jgi:SPP1 family predicted phage head-tail adaptor
MAAIIKDPCALAAGTLRHAITILQQTIIPDSVSGNVDTYTMFLSTRAIIEPIHGTDLVRSGQDATQLFITVTIRYQPGITSTMRLQTDSATYRIVAIENVLEKNRVLKILCLALGANE